jgi:hypothetical protein
MVNSLRALQSFSGVQTRFGSPPSSNASSLAPPDDDSDSRAHFSGQPPDRYSQVPPSGTSLSFEAGEELLEGASFVESIRLRRLSDESGVKAGLYKARLALQAIAYEAGSDSASFEDHYDLFVQIIPGYPTYPRSYADRTRYYALLSTFFKTFTGDFIASNEYSSYGAIARDATMAANINLVGKYLNVFQTAVIGQCFGAVTIDLHTVETTPMRPLITPNFHLFLNRKPDPMFPELVDVPLTDRGAINKYFADLFFTHTLVRL